MTHHTSNTLKYVEAVRTADLMIHYFKDQIARAEHHLREWEAMRQRALKKAAE